MNTIVSEKLPQCCQQHCFCDCRGTTCRLKATFFAEDTNGCDELDGITMLFSGTCEEFNGYFHQEEPYGEDGVCWFSFIIVCGSGKSHWTIERAVTTCNLDSPEGPIENSPDESSCDPLRIVFRNVPIDNGSSFFRCCNNPDAPMEYVKIVVENASA